MKKTNYKRVFDEIRTRFGLVIVAAEDGELCQVSIEHEETMGPDRAGMIKDPEAMLPFTSQITLYLEGKLTRFDLPIRLSGTPFQNRVWSELLKIPYGETRSYQDIAKVAEKIGRASCRERVS
jgi:methylated-DNA-[protein]-cysteine S-methyltransferase